MPPHRDAPCQIVNYSMFFQYCPKTNAIIHPLFVCFEGCNGRYFGFILSVFSEGCLQKMHHLNLIILSDNKFDNTNTDMIKSIQLAIIQAFIAIREIQLE